jgi:hypothetical protein
MFDALATRSSDWSALCFFFDMILTLGADFSILPSELAYSQLAANYCIVVECLHCS